MNEEDIDRERCAQEPIHIPGAIQPHGCLLAFDRKTLVVSQVSVNVADLLGFSVADLLNRPLTSSLPEQACRGVVAALSAPSAGEPFFLEIPNGRLQAELHEHAGVAIMEVEAWGDADSQQPPAMGSLIRRLSSIDDLQELVRAVAQVVRDLTGFDRVLVYRFDDDDHGEVISEAKADDMDPYLGLNYPESDIPRQARALYLRNWIRSIPNGRYQPVPLVPLLRPDNGLPLDLSHAVLRSVSPVHLQYLANMGLQASMSVSLVVAGRLWGLISCGHRLPRDTPLQFRTACETIGRMVSLHISSLQTLDLQRKQAAKAVAVRHLVEALREADGHGLDGLPSQPRFLLDIARAAGAAVVSGETVSCTGSCPDVDTILSLSRWVSEHGDAGGIFSTRQLTIDEPLWAGCADVASGLLAMLLPTPLHSCVLWFRPELVHTVDWAETPTSLPSPARL